MALPNDPEALTQMLESLQREGSPRQALVASLLLQQQQTVIAPEDAEVIEEDESLKNLKQQNKVLQQRLNRALRRQRDLLDNLDYLLTKNDAFAQATGACSCWGEDPECPQCTGQGRAGWKRIDKAAYRSLFGSQIQ